MMRLVFNDKNKLICDNCGNNEFEAYIEFFYNVSFEKQGKEVIPVIKPFTLTGEYLKNIKCNKCGTLLAYKTKDLRLHKRNYY